MRRNSSSISVAMMLPLLIRCNSIIREGFGEMKSGSETTVLV